MASRRGAALLLVIVIIGLLAFLVTEFQRKAHLEAVSAQNSLLLAQAHALTRSGVAAAVSLLKEESENTTDDRSELWYFGEGEESAQAVPVGDFTVSLLIEDQYGKFPLGALVDQNGKAVANRMEGFRRMVEAMAFEDVDADALTQALVDWIDDDSDGDRYESNAHFTVPNARLKHLDELGRVDVFSDLKPQVFRKLLSKLDVRNDPAINVNTASPEVLLAIHRDISLEDARTLYAKLGDTPDATGAATTATIPEAGRAFPVAFKSKRFRVITRGDAKGVLRQAECILETTSNGKTFRIDDWIQF